MKGTPYADDGLRIDRHTDPEDVRDFVLRRVKGPLVFEVEGITVWNFSTHEPDMEALEEQLDGLRRKRYIIPYQVSGAWGYMQDLLPDPLRDVELLVYSVKDGTYKPFPNFRRESDPADDRYTKRSAEQHLIAMKWEGELHG